MLTNAIRTVFRIPIAFREQTCLMKTICFATIALAIFIRTPIWTVVGLIAFGLLFLPGRGRTGSLPVSDEDRR